MQLTHIIRETRYLDRMTFTIPEVALNVTLQEDRYLQCVDGLTDMLERYYKVMHQHMLLLLLLLLSSACVCSSWTLLSTVCHTFGAKVSNLKCAKR